MKKEWEILFASYTRYKLLWMLHHSVSLADMAGAILYEQRIHPECEKEACADAAIKLLSYAESSIRRSGGCLYPDLFSFRSGAYQDEAMMKTLLHKDEYDAWEQYRKCGALSGIYPKRCREGGQKS